MPKQSEKPATIRVRCLAVNLGIGQVTVQFQVEPEGGLRAGAPGSPVPGAAGSFTLTLTGDDAKTHQFYPDEVYEVSFSGAAD